MREIYVPAFSIIDGKDTTLKLKYGPVTKKYFWLRSPHELHFQQDLSIVIFCSLDFSSYPFDSNQCDLKFISFSSSAKVLSLSQATILNENSQRASGNQVLKSSQTRLPFDITLQSLEPINQTDIDYMNPVCGMRLFFQRKGLGTLLGSFYYPTGAIALLGYSVN